MLIKYKTLPLRTIKQIKRVEFWQAHGWKVVSGGLDTVTLSKALPSNPVKLKRFPDGTIGLPCEF